MSICTLAVFLYTYGGLNLCTNHSPPQALFMEKLLKRQYIDGTYVPQTFYSWAPPIEGRNASISQHILFWENLSEK